MMQDKRGTGPLVIDGKVWDGRHMTGRQLNEMLKGRSPWDESIQRATAEYLGRSTTGTYSKSSTPAPVASPALKTFSIREVTPYGAWQYERAGGYLDTFTDYLARELGLKSKPRLRWFSEIVEGVKQGDGWQSCSVPSAITRFNGLFDHIRREVWIRDGLSYQHEKQMLTHEYRHCWQCDNYGTDYVTTHRDAAEIDADAFASQYA